MSSFTSILIVWLYSVIRSATDDAFCADVFSIIDRMFASTFALNGFDRFRSFLSTIFFVGPFRPVRFGNKLSITARLAFA